MAIRVTKHHIGAEIISILTRGMYPDPKDALREYVQNGVDAGADNIEIKIRGSSIVVADDGYGMEEDIMKDAVRVGISDKNPNADVGFRGIGIYSAFHLCDELRIYSRAKGKSNPNFLIFDFQNMRETLKQQQLDRFKGKITGEQLIDLQSILQSNIKLKKLKLNKFPETGTRVEMRNLDSSFFKSLSRFDEVADYLRQVVPLHFDRNNFKWAKKIEEKVSDICKEHKAQFNLVNLTLQVDTKIERLYRPYTDNVFHDKSPLMPIFRKIKSNEDFFGVAWGCLNAVRKKITNTSLRGFLLKKQGFALGRRSEMAKHFGKRTTYFDRYVGEIIVVKQDLLPNAARTDFEVSTLRTSFYEALAKVAMDYNDKANKYQEYTLGDEQLESAIDRIEELESAILFSYEKVDQLLDYIVEIRGIWKQIDDRIKRGSFRDEKIGAAKDFVKTAKSLEKQIQSFIKAKKDKGKTRRTKETPETKSLKRRIKLAKKRKKKSDEKQPEDLVEVFESIDITLSEEAKRGLEVIDERFVQASTSNREDYLMVLKELKEELEDLLSGE